MARKKNFEMDGAVYVITPLTLSQVETWKSAPTPEPSENLIERFTPHLRDVICPSLNNVLPKATLRQFEKLSDELDVRLKQDPKDVEGKIEKLRQTIESLDVWTPERCFAEMDKDIITKMFSEIIEFSGYRFKTADELVQQGEAQAPSISQQSAGA